MDKSIGKRIERIKDEERLGIEEFTKMLNVSKTAYYGWLNGVSFPGSDVIITILTKFPSIKAEWLLLGNGEMRKVSSNSSMVAEPNKTYGKQGISKSELKKLLQKMIDELDNL